MLKTITFILLIATASYASLTEAEQQAAAKRQLQEMNAAIERGDIDTFISYLHPSEITLMGGKDSLTAQMKRAVESVVFANGKSVAGEPSAIFHVGSQLQCILSDTNRTTYKPVSPYQVWWVIAISDDDGKRWTFIVSSVRSNVAEDSYKFYLKYRNDHPKLDPDLEKMLVEKLRGGG
jgi:uncharacterized membrane protein YvbJ